jgi:hypothetical protein
MPSDEWTYEEADDPLYADRRNFYKVEKWSRDGQRIEESLFAGSSLDKARRVFDRFTTRRPRSRLTIHQRTECCRSGLRSNGALCFRKKKAPDLPGLSWVGRALPRRQTACCPRAAIVCHNRGNILLFTAAANVKCTSKEKAPAGKTGA